MLAIARALMSRPRFLMLDEPSLGIMPRLVDQVMDSLRVVLEGTSVELRGSDLVRKAYLGM
jgi:branched-chain amino acid transport system ATP-binding protein